MNKLLKCIFVLLLLSSSAMIFAKAKKNAKDESVTINLYYTGENGSAKKYVEEMISSGLLEEVRKASGNIKYDYFFCAEDSETVLLIDSWENRQAIENYHNSQLAKKVFEIQEKYNLQKKFERYKADK